MSLINKASLIQIPSGYKNGKLYSVKPNPSYGSEQISNGDFSDGSTGWTVTNGTVTDKYNASMTAYQNGIKVTPFTLSGTYKLVFDLTITSGSCKFDGGGSNSQTYTTSGRKELTITNPTKFEFNAFNLGWVGTLDNVSVKEVLVADGDFTFSRSSSGTRVNSEGLIEVAQVLGTTEEVTNGDFATDTAWNKNANWSISGGVAIADGTSSNDLNQGTTNAVIGKKYFISFDVVSLNQGTFFAKIGGVGVVGNQVGSFSATVTATSTDRLRIIAQSNAIGTIDNVSVIEYIENDVPRLDYSGGASCASLLLEPQRTNLLTYSNDFTQWTIQSGVTATHNTTETLSPDGTNNATKFVGNGTSGVLKSTLVTGVVARSVYLKSVSGTVNVIFKDPIFTVTQKSLSVTTEWQRFDLIEDNTHSSTQGLWIDDIPSSGIYMWGGQLEAGSYPTSYIPTTTAAVTRTADVCNNAGTSATFNDSEGVLFAEIYFQQTGSTNGLFAISDGSFNNLLMVRFAPTHKLQVEGTGGVNIIEPNTRASGTYKIAAKYDSNGVQLWVDGSKIVETSTQTTMSGIDEAMVGESPYGNRVGCKTKQLMTFNEALSDEELSDLTGQVNLSFNNLATFYNYTIL